MSENLEKETVKQKIAPPKMWNVILHNDDFTTIEFVVELLMALFNKNESQAAQIAMNVHSSGKGIAGQYTKEVAETKVAIAQTIAMNEQHPLKIEMQQG